MRVPNIASHVLSIVGYEVGGLVKLDEAVTRMRLRNAGRAWSAAIPIRTVKAFPPDTDYRVRAEIAGRWVSERFISFGSGKYDSVFQTTEQHSLECMCTWVQVRCVKQW